MRLTLKPYRVASGKSISNGQKNWNALKRSGYPCGAQKLIGDLQESEIAKFFVVLPGPAESPLAFLIERFIA